MKYFKEISYKSTEIDFILEIKLPFLTHEPWDLNPNQMQEIQAESYKRSSQFRDLIFTSVSTEKEEEI